MSALEAEAQSRDTEPSARDHELALCDEIIRRLSGENARLETDIDELDGRVNSLEDDLDKTKNTVASLRNEKDQKVKQLENVTAQNKWLVEKVEALRSQRDKLHTESLTLHTEVLVLQMDLAVVTDKKYCLQEKFKNSSDELKATKNQLEALEHERSEACAQLELAQAKSTADLELFQLHEDALKAEVKKGGEAAGLLWGKVKDAEDESRRMAKEHNASTTILKTNITDLKNRLHMAMNEKDARMDKLKDASDELGVKKTRLEGLQREESEALAQLEPGQASKLQSTRETGAANRELFRLKEEEPSQADGTADRDDGMVQSLQEEVDAVRDSNWTSALLESGPRADWVF